MQYSSFTRSLHGEDKASTNIHKCSHLNSVSRFFFTHAFKLKYPRSFRVHMHGTIMELEAVDAGCWRTHAPTDQLIFLKKKHVYHWDTTMFKVVPGLSTTQCPPYINYYSKSDRSLDKLVPRKTNTTTFLLQVLSETGILYQTELLKSSQWKLWKKSPGAMFKKTLTPLLIFIQHAHHVSFF